VLQPVVGKIFKVQKWKILLYCSNRRAHRLDKTGVAEGEPNKPTSSTCRRRWCVNKSYDSLKLETLASKTSTHGLLLAAELFACYCYLGQQ